MIRRLTALQDRAKLAKRILLYYLLVSAAAVGIEHLFLAHGTATYAQLAFDIGVRAGIGAVLFFFACRLIRSQEATRGDSIRSTMDLLERLAMVSEFRDGLMAAHNSRIGTYCELVGRELGLDAEQTESLKYAASLHDIGKIAIPDSILLKRGALTADQRSEMERHVLYGAQLLHNSHHPVLNLAYNAALTHHENWDGTGYPNHLKGYDIPLSGRIVGLCDTFDALISERPYKDAWKLDEAVLEILRCSGKRFDPVVVAAFMRALPEIQNSIESLPAWPSARYRPLPQILRPDSSLWSASNILDAVETNERALHKLLLSHRQAESKAP
jgi:HD-GYP domain-containing protein (c-di-GMP phosphodiesterase class II)